MASRLTDLQKKKIIADYLINGSYRATAKMNGVAVNTVKSIVSENDDFAQKCTLKKEENTQIIMAYLEKKTDIVCEIIGKALDALNDEEKIREATLPQITTAIGTLIDKFTQFSGNAIGQDAEDDELSKAMMELAKEMDDAEAVRKP